MILLQAQRDQLVSRLEASERYSAARRGNLRLFFGGSAGLTAVRTMLETARSARQTGVDVVVGLVNSAGSCAIDRLLDGFDRLPALRSVVGARHTVRIDVDAVKKRLPAVLLVDTRVPLPPQTRSGAHPVLNYESWADIENVLASGVNVWAALDATGFSSWTSVGVAAPPRVSGLSLLWPTVRSSNAS